MKIIFIRNKTVGDVRIHAEQVACENFVYNMKFFNEMRPLANRVNNRLYCSFTHTHTHARAWACAIQKTQIHSQISYRKQRLHMQVIPYINQIANTFMYYITGDQFKISFHSSIKFSAFDEFVCFFL